MVRGPGRYKGSTTPVTGTAPRLYKGCRTRRSHGPLFLAREGLDGARLVEWMTMTQEEFSRRFKDSPIKRTKRRGLLRNVAVALGNWGSAEAVPALAAALNDEEALVRGHAAWALGAIASVADCPPGVIASTSGALLAQLPSESDAWVRDEIRLALGS